jgi:hypothetical protein
MKTRRAASYSRLLLGAWLLLLIVPAFARNKKLEPIVIQQDQFGVSQAISEIAKTTGPPEFHGWIVRKEHEARHQRFTVYDRPDPVIQDSAEPLALPITFGFNFDGMNGIQAGGVIPPDTNGAVGDKQFFLITNFAFNIYDKTTGKLEVGPLLIHTIWSGFGGQCGTQDGGDPVVLFDKVANRWVVEQLEYFSSYQMCIAVSQTDDATGKYNLYAFTWATGLPDYPKLAVWPDAYYIAVNNYGSGQGEPCAVDRNAMLAGKTATMICFTPSNTDFGYLPSDVDGATQPPSGAPNHYIELGNSNTTLKEYDFHVDFKVPKNSTFMGPHTITVPAYTTLCGGGNGACIPEPHGGGLLDAIGDRMMFRNAYRNFGDHEAMVFSHSVAPGPGSTATAAERWYELRSTPPGGSFSVYQAATYQNKTNSYWMGSAAMDKNGNMALGFSVDNKTTLDPSIWVTGRLATDALNKLEGTKVVHKGTQVQGQVNRWGDYSSMSVDPTDDCTFWYSQEYTDGGYNWQSHVVSFKFNSCH